MAWDDDDDLAQLALNLRAQITDAGLRVSPVAPSSHRSPDVLFVHPDVRDDALVEMLAALQPALVFVTAESFDQDEVDWEDERIRASAASHADDVFRVSVTWPSDGLLFTWFVTAGWHDDLMSESEIAAYQARGLDEVERELRFERVRSASGELMALILASPEFRAATTNRRTAQMKLIMGSNPDLVDEIVFQRDFEARARANAATEVARWEQQLAADDGAAAQVAEKILGSRTQRDFKARAADAVREMADGWSLTEGFVDLMLSRAKEHNAQQR